MEEIGNCGAFDHRKAPVAMHPVLGAYLNHWQVETTLPATDRLGLRFNQTQRSKTSLRQYRQSVVFVPSGGKAGVLHSVEGQDQGGKLVRARYFDLAGNPVIRWGWHNLRHSLASWLVSEGVDVKTVSSMLRHSNVETTLGIYSHAVGSKQLAAQGRFLDTLLGNAPVQ